MIHTIKIENFRCFEKICIDDCRRINVIVGDNGTGKTALLESLFLTLSGNMEVSLRLKAMRGLEGMFAGTARSIEEALWRDLFYHYDWSRTIKVNLIGDGPEQRSFLLHRRQREITIPYTGGIDSTVSAPLTFEWTDFMGAVHNYIPKITKEGLQVEGSSEDLPDFFFFGANVVVPATEVASRFSDLSKTGRHRTFVELITREFPIIRDFSIEVTGGAPVVHATLRNTEQKIPINNISGGLNRIVGIMLTLAGRSNSVVLIDEAEIGLYHKHQAAVWRAILLLRREYDGQIFMTTHSDEWIYALMEASDGHLDDISLWRMETSEEGTPILHRFSGKQAKAAVKVGEVR